MIYNKIVIIVFLMLISFLGACGNGSKSEGNNNTFTSGSTGNCTISDSSDNCTDDPLPPESTNNFAVELGGDRMVDIPNPLPLAPKVTGTDASQLSYSWSKVTGPGNVSFSSTDSRYS